MQYDNNLISRCIWLISFYAFVVSIRWLMGLFRDRSSSELPRFNLVTQVNNGSLLDYFCPSSSGSNASVTGLSEVKGYGGLRLGPLRFRWESSPISFRFFNFKCYLCWSVTLTCSHFGCRWFQVVGYAVRCAPRLLTSSSARPLRVVSPHVIGCSLFIVLSLALLVVRLLCGKMYAPVTCVTLLWLYSLASALASVLLLLSFCWNPFWVFSCLEHSSCKSMLVFCEVIVQGFEPSSCSFLLLGYLKP